MGKGRSLGIRLALIALAGLFVMVQPGGDSASAAPAVASERTACTRPASAGTYLAKLNALVDVSIQDFMAARRASAPCWMDWSNDGCSTSPDSGPNFDFHKSCLRHDFSYRNSKRLESSYGVDGWSYHNKAVADTAFRRDMTNHCYSRSTWEIEDCLSKMRIYYNAVASVGDFASTVGDFRYTFVH